MTRKKLIIGVVFAIGIAGICFWFLYAWFNRVLPQRAVGFLSDLPAPQKGEVILVFTPHPDDETIAAGGYIISAVNAGAEVWITLVTDGNYRGQELKRYSEFKKATGILGVPEDHLFFLGYPDHKLKEQDLNQVQTRFEEIIATVRPQIIVAPCAFDHHPDHKTTGEIVEKIWRGSNLTLYQFLVHHNLFPDPKGLEPQLYLLPPARMLSFGWEKFMLDDELEAQKLSAVLQYQTQLHDKRNPLLRGLLLGMVKKNELFVASSK